MPLLTLGQATATQVRLIVWCRACQHRFEPDNAELVEQHGAETTVLTWSRRLRCTECGERDADFVVSGARRKLRSGKRPPGRIRKVPVPLGAMAAWVARPRRR